MATKLPVAQTRMFTNVFICKDCNQKIRTQAVRVIAGKVRCIKCGGHRFRPIKKK
jgi:Zn finger protein HypA/HybF involved in hydrogenase expression